MSTLVAYFSATGTTAHVAQRLAKEIGADLYEIAPKVKYTDADLNWMDKNSRSTQEMRDRTSRPALADHDADIAAYDTVFVGFPIWWYVAPTIVNSFLEAYDFTGKKVVLFATSGGSGMGKTLAGLKDSAPGAQFVEGKVLGRGKIPAHGRRACFERDKLAPFYAAVHKRADGFARRGKYPCKIFRDAI